MWNSSLPPLMTHAPSSGTSLNARESRLDLMKSRRRQLRRVAGRDKFTISFRLRCRCWLFFFFTCLVYYFLHLIVVLNLTSILHKSQPSELYLPGATSVCKICIGLYVLIVFLTAQLISKISVKCLVFPYVHLIFF